MTTWKAYILKFFPALLIGLAAVQAPLTPAPAAAAKPDSSRTITVISFDGMRHDLAEEYMKAGMLPHFKKVKKNALYARDIRTVYPSLTAASHAAISTGAKPGKTGMISNNLHEEKKGLTGQKSAFYSPLETTPIWAEARKQGKTTATVLFPGSNPMDGNEATYSVYYGKTWAGSSVEKLKFKKANGWENAPDSHSPLQEAAFALKLSGARNIVVHVLAADTKDDKKKEYDAFYFSVDKKADPDKAVQKNDWGSVTLNTDGKLLAGFHFKWTKTSNNLSDMELYRTAVTSAVIKGPEGFAETIQKKFGFFPAQDDDHALEEGWIKRKEYEEISERFAKWTTDVSLYIKKEYKPDLLLFYYPQIDHEEHKYLLTDPRQPGYTPEKSKEYMGYIKWAYTLADRSLGKVLESAEENDLLFLVSDHGMEPVHSMISPNDALEKAGLIKKGKDGKIDPSQSKAYAVASGSVAHIYINLKGREKGGIVAPEEYKSVQKEIVQVFKNLEADKKHIDKTATASSYFKQWWSRVRHGNSSLSDTSSSWKTMIRILAGVKEKPIDDITLSKDKDSNAGDVILAASKGYYIAQDELDQNIAETPAELGSHGGNPKRRELRPIFYVTGPGIRKEQIRPKITTLDIAPTLYELLDLETPEFVDGKPIKKVVKKIESRN